MGGSTEDRELYDCPGCDKRKPASEFPDNPAIPGLCRECDDLLNQQAKECQYE